MANNIDNLVLEQLRAIRADTAKLSDKMDLMLTRQISSEQHVSALTTHDVGQDLHAASVDRRLDRIERRLELNDEKENDA